MSPDASSAGRMNPQIGVVAGAGGELGCAVIVSGRRSLAIVHVSAIPALTLPTASRLVTQATQRSFSSLALST
jgi:hypothetical protein